MSACNKIKILGWSLALLSVILVVAAAMWGAYAIFIGEKTGNWFDPRILAWQVRGVAMALAGWIVCQAAVLILKRQP